MHHNQQTILIVSHQERILDIADEIVLVADGQIQQQGSKEAVLPNLMRGVCSCDFYGEEK